MQRYFLPGHLIEIRVEPPRPEDMAAMINAITESIRADDSLQFVQDAESGELTLKGRSEAHLGNAVRTLTIVHGVEVNAGAPQVCYLETISKSVTADYTHKRLRGGHGEFARVIVAVAPEPGGGNRLHVTASEDTLPQRFHSGLRRGFASILSAGVLAGFPVFGVVAEVIDGAWHETDSDEHAFEVAIRAAMREALQAAGPVMLEPVMNLEIEAPEELSGEIIGGLNTRRGFIESCDNKQGRLLVQARVPFANLIGHTSLPMQLRDQIRFELRYSHHQPVSGSDRGPDDFGPAVGMRA